MKCHDLGVGPAQVGPRRRVGSSGTSPDSQSGLLPMAGPVIARRLREGTGVVGGGAATGGACHDRLSSENIRLHHSSPAVVTGPIEVDPAPRRLGVARGP